MKKHLIAAAVAGALAVPAMAQVEIYGVIGAAYENTDLTIEDAGVQRVTTGAGNRQAGNRVGFRGTEDLGGGMKGSFVYELNTDIASGMGTVRRGFVALGGGFGEIRLGREDTPTRQVYNGFTAFGNSGFAPGNMGATLTGALASLWAVGEGRPINDALELGCTAIAAGADRTDCTNVSTRFGFGGTRANGVTYVTPNMSGLQAQVQYAQASLDVDGTRAKDNDEQLNLGVSYSAGPLAVSLGYDTSKFDEDGNTGDDLETKTMMLGGRYDLGMAKVFLTYTDKAIDSEGLVDFDVKDTAIGVSIPVGALELIASYSDGELKDKSDNSKTDNSAYMFIANYKLSKRTHAYLMIGESKFDLDDGDLKNKGYTLGVQHNF